MTETERYVSFLLNKQVALGKNIDMSTFRMVLYNVCWRAFLDRWGSKQDVDNINVTSLLFSYKNDIVNVMRKFDIKGIEDEINQFDDHYYEYMDKLTVDEEEFKYNRNPDMENFLLKNVMSGGFRLGKGFDEYFRNEVEYLYTDNMFDTSRLRYPQISERYMNVFAPNLAKKFHEIYDTRVRICSENRSDDAYKRLYKENLLGKNDINPFAFNDNQKISDVKTCEMIPEEDKKEIIASLSAKEMVAAYTPKAKKIGAGYVERDYVENTLHDIIKLKMVHNSRSKVSRIFGAMFGTAVGKERDLIETLKETLVENSTTHNHPLTLEQVNKAISDAEVRHKLLQRYSQTWTDEKIRASHIESYNKLENIEDPLKKEIGEAVDDKSEISDLDKKENEMILDLNDPQIN